MLSAARPRRLRDFQDLIQKAAASSGAYSRLVASLAAEPCNLTSCWSTSVDTTPALWPAPESCVVPVTTARPRNGQRLLKLVSSAESTEMQLFSPGRNLPSDLWLRGRPHATSQRRGPDAQLARVWPAPGRPCLVSSPVPDRSRSATRLSFNVPGSQQFTAVT